MTIMGKCVLVAGFFVLALAFSVGAADTAAAVKAFRVGDLQMWAIADSMGERSMDVFKAADPALLDQYVPTGKTPSAIMTFALKTGGKTILIDTGLGSPSGDRASRLMAGLKSIDLDPETIDVVLITHMHGDHIGGLIWDGKKAFPNATVLIGKVELDFWLAGSSMEQYPSRKANFELVRKVVDMYGDKVKTFAFDEAVAEGVTAVSAVGHTPGHTAFFIESGSEKLLCIGDLLHAAALQFPHPEINASYDMVPELAAVSRQTLLEFTATHNYLIAGMHLPFAGIGRVEKIGEGSYTYKPEF